MRVLAVAVMLLLFALRPVQAETFHAAFSRIAVTDTEPFDAMVWYPTDALETPSVVGPYTLQATHDAPIAGGPRFPLVLLSHGSGGTPMLHRELAAALARAGFIVVAPTHIGDSAGHPEGREAGRQLMDRPRQAIRTLDTALADPRFAPRIDPARIGMIGFSAGGYTTLILAGARPNWALAAGWCMAHPADAGSCGTRTGPNPSAGALLAWQPPAEPRLKAIVLMDPLAIMFDAAALSAIRIPVLLIRPADDSYVPADGNALAVARGLNPPPEQIVVPGAHFVLGDPCPSVLRDRIPAICVDAPGVDRVAVHRRMEDEIAQFFLHRL